MAEDSKVGGEMGSKTLKISTEQAKREVEEKFPGVTRSKFTGQINAPSHPALGLFWEDAWRKHCAPSPASPAESLTDEQVVRQHYKCEMNMVRGTDGMWLLYRLPFYPESVGAERVGSGDTEVEAWADTRRRIEAAKPSVTESILGYPVVVSEDVDAGSVQFGSKHILSDPVQFAAPDAKDARIAELEAEAEKEERAHLQTIAERDAAEDALGEAYTLVTGKQAEWSNLFGYDEALEEMRAVHGAKDTRIVEFDDWFGRRFPVIDSLTVSNDGTSRYGMTKQQAVEAKAGCREAWNAALATKGGQE